MTIDRREGRCLFGSDPAAYDAARPGHAGRVYEVLVERCGLLPGTTVLEVGPGTGQASRRMLELGAQKLVAVEPDPRLRAYLREQLGDRVELIESVLEDAAFEPGAFDLAVAASSFHWVDEGAGLAKIIRSLRPGGWIALWWTLFGEGDEKDAFMLAVDGLLTDLPSSPSSGWSRGGPAFALDVEAREDALERAGFVDVAHDTYRWSATWDSAGIRALYGTFSPIRRLDDARRESVLDEIERIAEHDFGGRVDRRLITSLFTARKPS